MGHHHPAPLQQARRLPPLDEVAFPAVGDGRAGAGEHRQGRGQGGGTGGRGVVVRVGRVGGREGLGHARQVIERNGTGAEGGARLAPHDGGA